MVETGNATGSGFRAHTSMHRVRFSSQRQQRGALLHLHVYKNQGIAIRVIYVFVRDERACGCVAVVVVVELNCFRMLLD